MPLSQISMAPGLIPLAPSLQSSPAPPEQVDRSSEPLLPNPSSSTSRQVSQPDWPAISYTSSPSVSVTTCTELMNRPFGASTWAGFCSYSSTIQTVEPANTDRSTSAESGDFDTQVC